MSPACSCNHSISRYRVKEKNAPHVTYQGQELMLHWLYQLSPDWSLLPIDLISNLFLLQYHSQSSTLTAMACLFAISSKVRPRKLGNELRKRISLILSRKGKVIVSITNSLIYKMRQYVITCPSCLLTRDISSNISGSWRIRAINSQWSNTLKTWILLSKSSGSHTNKHSCIVPF